VFDSFYLSFVIDYGRINVTSTRLRESITAKVVEDKPISDLKTNNAHFSNDSF
jgi:hypothetical protein